MEERLKKQETDRLQKIEKIAIQSRLVVLILQVVFNCIIPDHDANVFNPPADPRYNDTLFDKTVETGLGGLRRWDAVYFIHIAVHGYTYENSAAFFPLYPVTVGKLADILQCFSFLGSVLSKLNTCLMVGVAVNMFLFVKTTSTLYRLGRKVLKDDNLAYTSALLFCVNPASIFMTAPYSESLFVYLSFNGLLCLASNQTLRSSIWFGLSSLTRSNGLVLIGFIVYIKFKQFVVVILDFRFEKLLDIFAPVVATIFLCVSSFLAYQYYISSVFCLSMNEMLPAHIREYGKTQGYHMPNDAPSPWCQQTLPLSYNYIQKHHWGLGILQYYEVKQIPNFMLAAPMMTLGVCACVCYYLLNMKYCNSLGLRDNPPKQRQSDSGFKSTEMFVYVCHLFFLTVFGVFFMHIQVLTRFLASSSPVIYWFAGYLVLEGQPKDKAYTDEHFVLNLLFNFSKQTKVTKLLIIYFIAYFVIGTAAFSNFLPWT